MRFRDYKDTLEEYFRAERMGEWLDALAKFVEFLLGRKTDAQWLFECLSRHGYSMKDIHQAIDLVEERERQSYAILRAMSRKQRIKYRALSDEEKEQIAERAQASVEDIDRLIQFFEDWWMPY